MADKASWRRLMARSSVSTRALYPHAYTVDAAACEEIGEWSVDIVGVDFDGDFSIADSFGATKPIRRDRAWAGSSTVCLRLCRRLKGMGITINAGSQLGSYGIDIAVGVSERAATE